MGVVRLLRSFVSACHVGMSGLSGLIWVGRDASYLVVGLEMVAFL